MQMSGCRKCAFCITALIVNLRGLRFLNPKISPKARGKFLIDGKQTTDAEMASMILNSAVGIMAAHRMAQRRSSLSGRVERRSSWHGPLRNRVVDAHHVYKYTSTSL